MEKTLFIGYVAAACTTVSFLPQVIKIFRTRHTSDLSLYMYAILAFGVAMWLIYGLLTHSAPVIAANAVTLLLALYILSAKMRYK